MIKNYLGSIFSDWADHSIEAVISQLEKGGKVLDLGCGDGKLTLQLTRKMKPDTLIGVDAFGKNNKFKIIKADLNRDLPFKDESFDAVISNYSLEHLYNTGVFISETFRILKKGGYTVVATDNLASWPAIASLMMGFQPSTLASGIAENAIGNPFALRSHETLDSKFALQWRNAGEYSHNKVLAYQALVDAYRAFGFEIENVTGAGYFPFKGVLSKIMAKIDKRHSHLLVLKARKPL